jgi:hypothetical protein
MLLLNAETILPYQGQGIQNYGMTISGMLKLLDHVKYRTAEPWHDYTVSGMLKMLDYVKDRTAEPWHA